MSNYPFRPRRMGLGLGLGLLLGSPLLAQAVVPYVETGLGRKQGDFGTPTQSTLWLGYVTGGFGGSRWDASLTVPYLSLSQEGGGFSSRDWGLGDLVARGAYRFLPETDEGWSLDGQGALKASTASEARGLGTGRTDFGGFLALHQQLGLFRWTLSGGWIQGSSTLPASTLAELTSGAYVVGLSGAWSLDRNRWELSFEARGPAWLGAPGAREVSLEVIHTFTSTWGLKATFTAGLNDGGARQSGSLALIHLFP